MSLPKPWRDDDINQLFSENLRALVPKGPLGRRVELDDITGCIDGENAIESVLDDRTFSRFTLPQRILSHSVSLALFSLGRAPKPHELKMKMKSIADIFVFQRTKQVVVRSHRSLRFECRMMRSCEYQHRYVTSSSSLPQSPTKFIGPSGLLIGINRDHIRRVSTT